MSMAIAVAQAVTDELNTGSYSESFTAERKYVPDYSLPEMKDLHVTVIPRDIQVAIAGRGRTQHDVTVDVAVQKRATTSAEMDVLMDLSQEISDSFLMKALAGGIWVKTEHRAIYSTKHAEEMNQFTSVFSLTFRIFK